MSWHVHEDTIEAYILGRIDDASAFSLEAHLLACASCRAAISTRVEVEGQARIWSEIRESIDRPRVGMIERALIRLGVPAHTARLLVVTPSLRSAWLLGIAACLAFAAIVSSAAVETPLPFLMLAPLIPLAGVAAAFGRPVDPAWEIGVASPTGAFRLMLIRAAGVLATSAALAGLATIASPAPGWSAAGWLVPSLALTVLTLVLSTVTASVVNAATIVGIAWVAGVIVLERVTSAPLAAFGPTAQLVSAVVAVGSLIALVGRRDAFERPAQM